jgi:hypothetical protein
VPIFIGRGAPIYDFLRYRCQIGHECRVKRPTVREIWNLLPVASASLGARQRPTAFKAGDPRLAVVRWARLTVATSERQRFFSAARAPSAVFP